MGLLFVVVVVVVVVGGGGGGGGGGRSSSSTCSQYIAHHKIGFCAFSKFKTSTRLDYKIIFYSLTWSLKRKVSTRFSKLLLDPGRLHMVRQDIPQSRSCHIKCPVPSTPSCPRYCQLAHRWPAADESPAAPAHVSNTRVGHPCSGLCMSVSGVFAQFAAWRAASAAPSAQEWCGMMFAAYPTPHPSWRVSAFSWPSLTSHLWPLQLR